MCADALQSSGRLCPHLSCGATRPRMNNVETSHCITLFKFLPGGFGGTSSILMYFLSFSAVFLALVGPPPTPCRLCTGRLGVCLKPVRQVGELVSPVVARFTSPSLLSHFGMLSSL